MKNLVTNYRYSVPIGVVVLAGLAWLAFGYFGVHTLFIDNEVDEALPTFDAGAQVDAEPVADAAPPVTADAAADEATTDDVAGNDATTDDMAGDDMAGDEATTDETRGEPEIVVEADGSFESLGRYSTSGAALVLGDGTGQRFLRFEDFETTNGPDLNVYLVNSSTGDVSDYVDLGDLSGNIGNQNYELPADVDLSVYDTVMIWCVRFSVGFGQASLQTA